MSSLAFPLSATAQEAGFPSRPIRLMIPYAPGGQQVLVENRGGAGGMVGTEAVVKSPADGYSIVLTNLALLAISPNMVKRPPYDGLKDLTPIAGIAQSVNILSATAGAPFNNARELVAYAKANPDKLSYASSGVGSFGHLSGEILRATAGARMVHVPFKTSALAFPDVIEGRVSMVFDSVSSTITHVRSGKVKPIAVMADRRSTLLPNVPTFAEEGFPEVTLRFWSAIHGPAGIPAPVVQRLSDAIARTVAAADFKERLASFGQDASFMSARELDELARGDFAKFARAIKAAGIEPQ
jgi:tripartite-type tricarboxylate transporter receptor subunit TctC